MNNHYFVHQEADNSSNLTTKQNNNIHSLRGHSDLVTHSIVQTASNRIRRSIIRIFQYGALFAMLFTLSNYSSSLISAYRDYSEYQDDEKSDNGDDPVLATDSDIDMELESPTESYQAGQSEILIPADGNCLYTAIFIATIIPVLQNQEKFDLQFMILIGDNLSQQKLTKARK
ncbi:MAG: hypothetical protein AAF770_03235 [Bacteroidota bacterium]